jgi:hypothetical protein
MKSFINYKCIFFLVCRWIDSSKQSCNQSFRFPGRYWKQKSWFGRYSTLQSSQRSRTRRSRNGLNGLEAELANRIFRTWSSSPVSSKVDRVHLKLIIKREVTSNCSCHPLSCRKSHPWIAQLTTWFLGKYGSNWKWILRPSISSSSTSKAT